MRESLMSGSSRDFHTNIIGMKKEANGSIQAAAR
jgi:hypothetical protein